jgi:tRNA modification GTPase
MINDTIVAPATTPGTGAISILRLSGPQCFSIADAVVRLRRGNVASSEGYTIHYGSIFEQDGSLLDDVLVSVFKAPHSYTGEDSVEISCHASSFIVDAIVRLLLAAGARFAEPGEFTKRAYLNGKMDLAQAEAVADVISSTTSASHRISMQQLRGGFSSELSALREELIKMASLLELELDFSEEEVEFASRDALVDLLERTRTHVDKLAESFRLGNVIKNGVPVAIAGAVNAGKSTLLNALVGDDRAIVSSVEGTTRDTIEETVNLGGILFRFIDTAGIRSTEEEVEKLGIDRTFRKISQASVVLGVVDSTASEEQISERCEALRELCDLDAQHLIFVLNKVDLLDEKGINKIVTLINNIVLSADNKCSYVLLSAKGQNGVEELKSLLEKSQSSLLHQNADATFVTNIRHYEALVKASNSLSAARTALTSGVPSDLVAEDLRSAISSINLILGTDLLSGQSISPETILHDIFRNHCIGK